MDILDNLISNGLLHNNNIYHSKYTLVNYNDTNFRLIYNKSTRDKGYVLEDNQETTTDNKTDIEEIERISRCRTKQRIRELALCNNFEYFGTITISGYFCDRYELTDCQRELKKILKKIKRKNSDLKYIIITEKHKDGAFHFHGLFSGLDLETNSFGYFHNKDFDLLGYNSFSRIIDYNKTCNYITKYITKDCVKNSTNQIFIRSRGLMTATKEDLDLSGYFIDFKYENDFVKIYDFDLNNLSEDDKKLVSLLFSSYGFI